MSSRLILETPCEHGQMRGHCEHLNTGTHLDGDIRFGACVVTCEGGVRTTLNPNYEAATEALYAANIGLKRVKSIAGQAKRTVDAALGLDSPETTVVPVNKASFVPTDPTPDPSEDT